MTTNKTKQKKVSIEETLKKIYNGEQKHFMYFHEDTPDIRHIAVVFTYNLTTGKGQYAASIWHKTVPEIISKKESSWDKKTHRETALARFEKCYPITFEIPFQANQDEFFPLLQNTIRNAIRRHGVKGERKNADLVQLQPMLQPIMAKPQQKTMPKEFQSLPMSSSSTDDSPAWKKRLRTRDDILTSVIH